MSRHPHQPGTLTPAQTKILQLVADGETAKTIAGILKRSTKTIVTHRCMILRNLNASTMAHAVAIGLRKGIIK